MIKKFFRRRKNKNNCVMSIIGILVCFVTIGFAAMATSLSINGSATVAKATWNVKFDEIRVFGGSQTPTTAANISGNTSVGFNVTLNQPNQYYKFLVDVVNEGTIDAMIKTITTPTVSGNLEFSATYKDGTAIGVNDALKAGETKTLLVTLKYKDSMASETTTQEVTYTINYGQADDLAQERAIEYMVDDFINLSNGVSTTAYNDGIQSEMYAFAHDATGQLGSNVDYRYIGKSPNNYITFNSETWRIIGVFQTDDGKNRLKIIKDEVALVSSSWDHKGNGVGNSTSEYGSNDWTNSQLMYFLNPDDIETNATTKGYTVSGDYVKDTNGTVIYEKGKIPAFVASGATTYEGPANSWRVSTYSLKDVDLVKYYLGGILFRNPDELYGTTEEIYAAERGTNVYSGRPTNWMGKVALMYPSDYAYTFAKGIDDTCYNSPGHCSNGMAENSWLYNSSIEQWTLSPRSATEINVYVVHGSYSNSVAGNVDGVNGAVNGYGVRPVVYLKSDIKLSGSGTNTNPYVIKS